MKIIHVLCGLALAATPALADSSSSSKAKPSADDQMIINHEHAVNQMEISLGQLAESKSTNKAIQGFGKDLVTDHKKADTDLSAYAKSHNAVVGKDTPASDGDKQAAADMAKDVTALKMMKGDAFDKRFLEMMVTGHEHEISKVDTFMGQASDADLKTMLTNIKPVMQKHDDTAKSLQAQTPRS